MSPRPIPEDLLPWALAELGSVPGEGEAPLTVVAGDASNRRYFRLTLAQASYVLVEAPPETEKNTEFLAVRAQLEQGGLRVPALYAADLDRGYLALEDLGDRLLLAELNADTVDECYLQAFGSLLKLAQTQAPSPQWPAYDEALLGEELSRFPQWFAQSLLDYSLTDADRVLFERLSKLLIDSALVQPRVLVHRDFHSRNLMPQDDGTLGVIDFQDAVMGPISYDLASLLKDCYIRWPREQVRGWALEYRGLLLANKLLSDVSEEEFLRWFDWMGLQRHIKVLGTFARLYLRDDKPEYLRDLPLVLRYVLEVLEQYSAEEPVFAEFCQWFQQNLSPLIRAQSWSASL